MNFRLFASLLLAAAIAALLYGYVQFASANPTSAVSEVFYQDEHARDIELRQAYLKLPLTETLDKRGEIAMARAGRAETGRTFLLISGVVCVVALAGVIAARPPSRG